MSRAFSTAVNARLGPFSPAESSCEHVTGSPVRARMIDDPAKYRWSSCATNLGHRPHSQLTPHPAWLTLGITDARRTAAYRCLLDEAIPEDTLAEIRRYLQQQRAWGRDDFQAMTEAKTHRFAGTRAAHRPRKAPLFDK